MHKIFVDFRGELTEEDAIRLLTKSGLATAPEAVTRWRQAMAAEDAEVERNWPRRIRQILSGESKFTSIVESDGVRHHWRHTDWYQRPEPVVDSAWERREMAREEAEKRWLESIRAQQLRTRQEPYPCLWEESAGGKSVLYYGMVKTPAAKTSDPADKRAEQA